MISRFMAALTFAVLTSVAVTSSVQAKHYKHYAKADPGPRAGRQGQQIDIAALPAYPTEQTNVGPQQPLPMGRKHIAPPASPSVAGIVRSAKTGATAHVSPKYASQFQAYINDLEAQGASIYYMGGYRKGPCANYSLHPCGMALDVCQDRRDHVSGLTNCHLPGRTQLARTAAAHGLFEGGQWCRGDMGHVQVGTTAAPCGKNLYAAVGEFQARSKHHLKLAHR